MIIFKIIKNNGRTHMKKATLNFGQFKQFDKVFITADNGIDVKNVTSVAFDGEILYIAQHDCLVE